ncbi:MAG: P1 family peptidase, partial [Steroidobacteraceae bacterium]
RMGSFAGDGSGDFFVAFSTANAKTMGDEPVATARFLENSRLDALFEATVQATEEAIVNSMIAARDMEGDGGRRAKALPHAALVTLLETYGRPSTPK